MIALLAHALAELARGHNAHLMLTPSGAGWRVICSTERGIEIDATALELEDAVANAAKTLLTRCHGRFEQPFVALRVACGVAF